MVAEAERFLHRLGFDQLRVRHHGTIARIEVPAEDIERISRPSVRDGVVCRLKEIGYSYVALDLQGYRTGSMNEVLPASIADSARNPHPQGRNDA